jgi:hypothetical protein
MCSFKYADLITSYLGRRFMSFCPKCGNKIDDTMTFCPKCGTPLKEVPPTHHEHEKGGKPEKLEHGFLPYLLGGIILIVVGLFSVLQISGALPDSGQNWAVLLFIVGIIIIIGAIYTTLLTKKYPRLPR